LACGLVAFTLCGGFWCWCVCTTVAACTLITTGCAAIVLRGWCWCVVAVAYWDLIFVHVSTLSFI
jgi:hypothetical protein